MNEAYLATLLLSLLVLPFLVALPDILPHIRSSKDYESAMPDTVVPEEDFTVLVPIYGNIKYLQNVEYLRQYGDRVVLCTSTGETDEFNEAIDRIGAENGFRVFKTPVDGRVNSGSALRSTTGVVRDPIIRGATHIVTTKYVVCIDADTETDRPLGDLVGVLRDRGLDLGSVRIEPSNTNSLLGGLQAHEYRMAMRVRRLFPWLVSGACHVGLTTAHRDIMAHHSMFFQGNDVELGVLGEALGYEVGHIAMTVPTEVPDTFRGWWRQRVAWSGGEFRLYVVNMKLGRFHPYFFAYGIVICLALIPFRWAAFLNPSWSLLTVALIYTATLTVVNWRTRNKWLLFYPFYGIFVSLVLPLVGLPSYINMSHKEHNWGIIRHRDPRPSRLRRARQAVSDRKGAEARERALA